jgi:hypothetical protein
MSEYKMVPRSHGTRRSFSITVGIRPGYLGIGLAPKAMEEAIEITESWMKGRAAKGLPYLTGTIVRGDVIYAWPEGDGKAGSSTEPVAIFQGEVSPLYNKGLHDGEVVNLLDELASRFGTELEQTRVYISYTDETWIMQAEKTETPTGESV